MRSSVRVAVQLIINRFRLRPCIRNLSIVLCVCVTISLLFMNYHGEHHHLEQIRVHPKFELDGITKDSRNLFGHEVGEREIIPSDSPANVHLRDTELVKMHETLTNSVLARQDYAATESGSFISKSAIPHLLRDGINIETGANGDHNIVSNLSHHSKDHVNSHQINRAVLPRVLLIYDNFSVDSTKILKLFLQTQRIDFDLFSSSKTRIPPPLSKLSTNTDEVIGRYALILCADVGFFLHRLSEPERQPLISYSRAFNVNIVAVQRTAFDHVRRNADSNFTVGKYIVRHVTRRFMSHVRIDDQREWFFAKGGVTVTNLPKSAHWQVFLNQPIRLQNVSRDSHLTLEYMQRKIRVSSTKNPNILVSLKYATNDSLTNQVSYHTSPLVLIDRDISPGVMLVLIGMDMRFWLTKLVLLDVIKAYSRQSLLRFDNKRLVMVDIDDIFVAPPGLRMTTDDVEVRGNHS